MLAVATIQPVKNRNRRAASRRTLHLDISLGATGETVTIHDLSPTGVLVETSAGLARFDELAMELPEVGRTRATVVWSSGRFFGCQFHDVLPKSAVSAALLRGSFEPTPALQRSAPQQLKEDDETPGHTDDDRLPLAVRLRVILGTSIALWALILWGLGVI